MSLEKIDKRLSERFKNGFSKLSSIPNPNLLKDSNKAVLRIEQALKNNEKIVLVGDYDVDGVISSVIAFEFFEQLGYKLNVVIPNRFKDGYGVTPQLITRKEFDDVDLVLTVDNGIHAFHSAEILRQRNIDLIITDHHNPSEKIPNAFAIVNPKQVDCEYPLKEICGAEVIWLLLASLKTHLNLNIDMGNFLELIAIAVVADVMPLTDVNHTIVRHGLKNINDSNRPAFQALKMALSHRNSFVFDDLGFFIAPRLNSSGRMKDAMFSFNFMTSKDLPQAIHYLEIIEELNYNRKEIEQEIFHNTVENIDLNSEIVLHYDTDLHEGVIGIVAARIVEKFQKPAILFSLDSENGILKGSARSVGNIDIFRIISSAEHLLLKWGGHKMAAGLSLKLTNFEDFKKIVKSKISNDFTEDDLKPESQIFGEVDLGSISLDLLSILSKYEPFGERNERPVFVIRDVEIIEIMQIGKNKQYLKLKIEANNIQKDVLVFKQVDNFQIGDIISFSCSIAKNEYRNRVSVSIYFEELINQ